jgi:hypothetical protein
VRRIPEVAAVEAPQVDVKGGRVTFILVIVVLLSVGLAALLGVNTALAQSSFTVNRLQKQISDLDDRATSLQDALSRANSPERLAADARRLGMVPAPGVAYLRLSDSTITGQTAFAAGDPRPVTPEQRTLEQQRAAAEKAKADAKAAKAAAKAAAEKARADATAAAAAEAARAAAARAAAQAAAARAAEATKEWQQKLAQQGSAGPRDGGAMLVAPPPERVAR